MFTLSFRGREHDAEIGAVEEPLELVLHDLPGLKEIADRHESATVEAFRDEHEPRAGSAPPATECFVVPQNEIPTLPSAAKLFPAE